VARQQGKKDRKKKIKQREREVREQIMNSTASSKHLSRHCYYFHRYSVLFYEELVTELQILYRINSSDMTSNFGIVIIVFYC